MLLCHFRSFFRRFRLLLPPSEGFRNIPPYCAPFRTVVKPVLLCAFLHLASLTLTDIRPANIKEPLLRPTSFQEDLSGTLRCFSVQTPFPFFCKRTGAGSIHVPSFSSSCSCFAAHFFQYTDRALCTSIFLTSLGTHISHRSVDAWQYLFATSTPSLKLSLFAPTF